MTYHFLMLTFLLPSCLLADESADTVVAAGGDVAHKRPLIYLIGNSLTWDTKPASLDGNVHWHVDCGKSLAYIQQNPAAPCVESSRLWPVALEETQYDFVSVQPHYGTTLEEDVAVISDWVQQQKAAVIVIHTGWAKHELFQEERNDTDIAGQLTHSNVYFDKLLKQLRDRFPHRRFRCTRAMNLLFQLADDIDKSAAPFSQLSDVYRDAIHMKQETGRYLMHNAMRQCLGQPLSDKGFPELDDSIRSYLKALVQGERERQFGMD